MPDLALPRKLSLETTAQLVELIRQGDARAREALPARYLAPLQQFAHRRLPDWARSLKDTDDLVVDAMVRALDRVEKGKFEPEKQGSFLAYAQKAVMRGVIDQIRYKKRLPPITDSEFEVMDPSPGIVRTLIAKQELERFEAAARTLPERQQDAILMHVKMESTYPEIALALGYRSAAAARMAVTRAIAAIAMQMSRDLKDGAKA